MKEIANMFKKPQVPEPDNTPQPPKRSRFEEPLPPAKRPKIDSIIQSNIDAATDNIIEKLINNKNTTFAANPLLENKAKQQKDKVIDHEKPLPPPVPVTVTSQLAQVQTPQPVIPPPVIFDTILPNPHNLPNPVTLDQQSNPYLNGPVGQNFSSSQNVLAQPLTNTVLPVNLTQKPYSNPAVLDHNTIVLDGNDKFPTDVMRHISNSFLNQNPSPTLKLLILYRGKDKTNLALRFCNTAMLYLHSPKIFKNMSTNSVGLPAILSGMAVTACLNHVHGYKFLTKEQKKLSTTKQLIKYFKAALYFGLDEQASELQELLRGSARGKANYGRQCNNKPGSKLFTLGPEQIQLIRLKVQTWKPPYFVPEGHRITEVSGVWWA